MKIPATVVGVLLALVLVAPAAAAAPPDESTTTTTTTVLENPPPPPDPAPERPRWQDGPYADLIPGLIVAVCFVVFAAGYKVGR